VPEQISHFRKPPNASNKMKAVDQHFETKFGILGIGTTIETLLLSYIHCIHKKS
jgi:hypothetical protein